MGKISKLRRRKTLDFSDQAVGPKKYFGLQLPKLLSGENLGFSSFFSGKKLIFIRRGANIEQNRKKITI